MTDADALKVAIDLFHLPSQVRAMRARPLPKGTRLLLRIASGDTDAMRQAQTLSDRSATAIREAAIFFVEQILLERGADEYRTLGLDNTAPANELRAHMALLIKWLHPDLNNDGHRSTMARQVIRAWQKVNSPDKLRRRPTTSDQIPTNAKQCRIETGKRFTERSIQPVARRTRKSLRILRFIAAAARSKFVRWKT
ncbi:heat shock protein DnaJ domain-containing protein [Hyphomicrobium denitrificans 1NES1]|uniref:Heat shock protein DnaJ domain-containing protein n=1 Tax=Hyphomicrobium denitrificans 1NES1 TaxID=670307 RepID=N0B7X8_9HYPH|nr:hypothetical protein [Hyphomicrobium denitrificans]AGK56636.1 heat shock protein DnaJ domain-containing protein [Hyphomicrobium denitrificans 1NES1]